MRKVLIITGSRGEYGYIRPLIKLIDQDIELDYGLVVSDMHLLETFGYSLDEIDRDCLKIDAKIYNSLDGYNVVTMPKSLGLFLMQIPEVLEASSCDLVLIAGDRGIQLMAAIAAAHMSIPVVHVQAGELSGNIDGYTRHAIARYSHIHLAANQESYDRLLSSGEQDFRIFKTGAPQLDELFMEEYVSSVDQLLDKYELDLKKPTILLVQHPITEEAEKATEQIKITLQALQNFSEYQVVVVLQNSDAGASSINKVLLRTSYFVFKNLPRQDYLGILKESAAIVGNSSSAIIEAPLFSTPALNIGRRQKDREYSDNVLHVGFAVEEITNALTKILNPRFRQSISGVSRYGDGKSSKKIIEILKNIPINTDLLNKSFFL